jgi:hypothetical protein
MQVLCCFVLFLCCSEFGNISKTDGKKLKTGVEKSRVLKIVIRVVVIKKLSLTNNYILLSATFL